MIPRYAPPDMAELFSDTARFCLLYTSDAADE